jgi:predicted O-methyltransferase YrrM
VNEGLATRLKFHPALLPVRRMRKLVADACPSLLLRLTPGRRAQLVREFGACTTVEQCIAFTRRHMGAGSCQIPEEIAGALEHMARTRPRVVCEIGTFDGGTSLLLGRFLPGVERMLCIDLFVKNKSILQLLAPPGLQLKFFDMPSYALSTVQRVAGALDGRSIDVLFIDGDHRYEGVKQDFLMYRRLVRPGGMIVFHDIVEDRGGRAWTGGVPRLWREVSPGHEHREFVHRRDQDGYGIGILTV